MQSVRYTQMFVRKTTGSVFSRRDESSITFRNVSTVHVRHVTRRFIQDFSYLNTDRFEGLL